MELRAQLQELSGLASSPAGAGPLGAPQRHMALQGPPLQSLVGLKTVAFREGV